MRYVRIELAGEPRILSLAEVWVLAGGENVAVRGSARQVATAFEGDASRAIDGGVEGVYAGGSVTHTPDARDPWWELDLGESLAVDQVTVWNRTDCCAERLEGYRLVLLDEWRAVVWERRDLPAPAPRADFTPWGAPVADPPPPAIDRRSLQPAIDVAIDRGVTWLLATQLRDGSWSQHSERFRSGQTALSLYALLKSGVPPAHPAVRRALAFLEVRPPATTYGLGCALMAYAALGRREHADAMERLVARLVDTQGATGSNSRRVGLWGYPEDPADLSNTQYAALGLRAAFHAGVDVPQRTWSRLLEGTLEHQEEPRAVETAAEPGRSSTGRAEVAGFRYRTDGGDVTGSMTTAGVAILAICADALDGKLARGDRTDLERARSLGLAWLADRFTVRENPGKVDRHLYYLYGLERVGGLCGLATIGGRDWYAEGAQHLVRVQGDRGAWWDESQTCYALLFLARATAPSSGPPAEPDTVWIAEERGASVRWRATGDPETVLWITGFAESTLAGAAADELVGGLRVIAVEYSADGEPIGVVRGDPDRAWTGERFALRHRFERNGVTELVARVRIVDAVAEGGERVLVSDPLRVPIEGVLEPWMLEYPRHLAENALAGAPVRATHSTAKPGFEGEKAVDGRHGSAWISLPDDAVPTLVLELDRPVKGARLLLSHVNPHRNGAREHDRATAIEVWIDRAKEPLLVRCADGDDVRKVEVDLGGAKRLRRLELRIVERTRGTAWPGSVGFSEVELLAR